MFSARDTIIVWLPWLISGLSIVSTTLVGNKDVRGWGVAIFNQSLWSIWVVASSAWGLIPLNIVLWVLHIRNYRKWRTV